MRPDTAFATRAAHREWRDVVAFLRASGALLLVGTAMRLLPFAKLQPALDALGGARAARSTAGRSPDHAAVLLTASDRAARLFGARCLARALTSRLLLARAGVDGTVVFGVRHGGPLGTIDAHAWLQLADGRRFSGEVDSHAYTAIRSMEAA